MTTSATHSALRTRQARISGPSLRLDRRVTAARPDLADSALVGLVSAPRFVDPVAMQCGVPVAMLHAAADPASIAVSALLHGETFRLLESVDGWSWGQCARDNYVGWVRSTDLRAVVPEVATHRIIVPTATVFTAPDIKSSVYRTLPLNADVWSRGIDGSFIKVEGGFIHRRHVAATGGYLDDTAAVAAGFVGSPYVWGGRTRDGIDCSGLTQAALIACGIDCPRDSDQQRDVFEVATGDLQRGDLVVFPGHVGILADAETLIHANAFWMSTTVERLSEVSARTAPTGYRRPLGPELRTRGSV